MQITLHLQGNMSNSSLIDNDLFDISDDEADDGISEAASIDPQVQAELSKLSIAADRIKTNEAELDKSRADFQCLLSDSVATVRSFSEKLGSFVKKTQRCQEIGLQARQLFSERNNENYLEHENFSHREYVKVMKQASQELKKKIHTSCLSTRRSLLQLNNLANQHQLQLLPYFEMKAQFNEMLKEQISKVPPFEGSNWKNKHDENFLVENSSEKFQETIDDEKSEDIYSEMSDSVTSFSQDSLSSENLHLEYLTEEDSYMDLPPSIKPTPELINCTVSSLSDNCFISPIRLPKNKNYFNGFCSKLSHNSFESNGSQCAELTNVNNFLADKVSFEDLSMKSSSVSSSESNSVELDLNMHNNDSTVSNDTINKVCEFNGMLTDTKSSDFKSFNLNLNGQLTDV